MELIGRGNTVYVGKLDNIEVDFIAISPNNNISYYQIALTTLYQKVLEIELKPLDKIEDQYPKYLLTLDTLNKKANYNGIIKLNALDWLLS